MEKGVREILQDAVGHSDFFVSNSETLPKEIKVRCDCLWCRNGGTLDQALTSLRSYYKQKLLEKMPKEEKLLKEIHNPTQEPLTTSDILTEYMNFGSNSALSKCKQIIEEVLK